MNSSIAGCVVAFVSSLIATDVIPAGETITVSNTTSGGDAISADEGALIGRTVKRTVYAGQRVEAINTRAPLLVSRNQTIIIKYIRDGLEISLNGRAMGSAGAGEVVTVMNTNSRTIIEGIVTDEGWVKIE